ncbi:hypothetical protein [Pelomonas sp. SE-A7]|uniref:hypothetical protein n=1 Tax=Pelomonas sp. SE-A7 TaxID=3054953 RepID=UPI00259D19D1|nr:hypothetical protein [Pelomonas sp. SE-A7]MDM4765966.1 hypothetical protein [Pelomonas sp. SE-A7]
MQDIVKTIEDLDSVAVSLPDLLRGARGQTVTSNARAIAELSELLKLEVLLDKPRAEVVASALRLLTLIKQTSLLVSSSRVGHEERVAMSLAEALASKLHKLLKDWAKESQAPTAS